MREVHFRARDIGYGIEEAVVRGEWCDDDAMGKRPLHVGAWVDAEPESVLSGAVMLYLFPDEVVSDEPAGSQG